MKQPLLLLAAFAVPLSLHAQSFCGRYGGSQDPDRTTLIRATERVIRVHTMLSDPLGDRGARLANLKFDVLRANGSTYTTAWIGPRRTSHIYPFPDAGDLRHEPITRIQIWHGSEIDGIQYATARRASRAFRGGGGQSSGWVAICAGELAGVRSWSRQRVNRLDIHGKSASTPRAPWGFRAQLVGRSLVKLTWVDGSHDETGFEIRGSWFHRVGANQTSAEHRAALLPGQRYTYRLRAVHAFGRSAEVTTHIDVPSDLPTPTALTTREVGTGVQYSWDYGFSEPEFDVAVTDLDSQRALPSIRVRGRSYEDRRIVPGRRYRVSVRATYRGAVSGWAQEAFRPYGVRSTVWCKETQSYFVLSAERLDFESAKSRAVSIGASLAKIPSQSVQRKIAQYFSDVGPVWIGLERDPRISPWDWRWQDRSRPTHTSWLPGEPNNANNREDAVVMIPHLGFGWNDAPRHHVHRALFEFRVRKWVFDPAGRHSYALLPPMDWDRARAEAARLGGDLVTIDSPTEERWIEERFPLTHFRIGLQRRPNSVDPRDPRSWEWAGGKLLPSTHRNPPWLPGEPNDAGGNERSVELYPLGGGWNDRPKAGELASVIEVDWRVQPFGLACGRIGLRGRLESLTTPRVTQPFDLLVREVPARTAVALLIGSDRERWGLYRLPLDLSPIGMSGCRLAVAPELEIAQGATASGSASFRLPVSTAMAGLRFYCQAAFLDANANAAGAALTNALDVIVGSR